MCASAVEKPSLCTWEKMIKVSEWWFQCVAWPAVLDALPGFEGNTHVICRPSSVIRARKHAKLGAVDLE